MSYLKMAFWVVLFVFLFVIFTLNVSQSVDFWYFYGTDDVFRGVPLFAVVFFSLTVGFLVGVFLMLMELFQYKRKLKKSEQEMAALRKEIDSHRNVAVKEFLNGEGEAEAGER